ncbi:MAG: tRNA pseudouridine(55) synthase TruB [Candidatus Omnitrophota bacterium]
MNGIMNGILIVNKPAGITSHDVVDFVRRKFSIRQVGHAGTLDPMATGVLVMLIGKATKLADRFLQDDKEYVARLFFGSRTDTQDATGKVMEEKECGNPGIDVLRKTLNSFLGDMDQVPPMVSAIKYKGRKLYQLARRGESITRKPRKVVIKDMELIELNFPEMTFRVRCSKGTYIRTLCEDIGASLGIPSHMSGLIRTRSGAFLLKDAKQLDHINEKDIRPA